ncbi:MAG: 4Fe-4S binding protein [Deltaproteobacteria bacterium]|nr:4Fe-4S binding protein [Deltaproteobacteria bacterium]
MTIILIVLAIYFLVRRIASPYIRRSSSVSDYLLIVIAVIPFATGYGLSHGAPEYPVRTIHVLSGELLLIVAVFLFVRAWLSDKRCTGCAACEVECPTGTIMSMDGDSRRTFIYNHYQCIDCGTCVSVCPEDAAELRHTISFKKLFNIISKERIRTVELSRCEGCGELIAPNLQVDKVGGQISKGVVHLCNKCKAKYNAENREGTELPIYFPSADIKKEATHESGINQGI